MRKPTSAPVMVATIATPKSTSSQLTMNPTGLVTYAELPAPITVVTPQ